MKAKDLQPAAVHFDKAAHRYLLIGEDFSSKTFTGVTTIISSVLFPNKYEGVDEEVMQRAACRGTRIHELCQATDTLPTEPQEGDEAYQVEVDNYQALKAAHNIAMIANEYLISNPDWGVASQIDCVDSEGNLYDIKTTYTLDKEYVSWQLSFYAEMFEYQNPQLKAGKLYAVWLRGDKCELVEVERKEATQIERALEAFKAGETLTESDTEEVASLIHIEERITQAKELLKALEDERIELLKTIQAQMAIDGIKTLENDRIKITIVEGAVTTKFDSKAFKADHLDLFNQYTTESQRQGYVKTTLL